MTHEVQDNTESEFQEESQLEPSTKHPVFPFALYIVNRSPDGTNKGW